MNLEKPYSSICAYYSGDRLDRKEASPEKETNLKQEKKTNSGETPDQHTIKDSSLDSRRSLNMALLPSLLFIVFF